jgi:hypothetical protein
VQSSITFSPTPTPTSSSKSTPIGGIVAGSVVGGIAVVAILVFGWYKVQRMRVERIDNAQPVGYNPPQQGYPPVKETVPENYPTSPNDPGEPLGAPLNEPMSGNNFASARLRYGEE